MEPTASLILDLGIVLLLAAGSGWVARRLGLPAVVGYLAAGLAVSPFTPGYVADREQIRLLADIGVVLLLFEVGIEVDLARLRQEHSSVLWLAPLQIVVGTALVGVVLAALGLPPFGAALLGLSIAMSSSVVVVNITRSRRRTTDRETERALLGWSVLQDVSGVALAAVILAAFELGDRPFGFALVGLLVYGGLAVAVAWLLPRILRRLRTEPDLFLIVTVSTALTVAALGAIAFHVPMALAAFVAGLAISEGHETAEARRRLRPFRDLFAVLFFVALGSLIDVTALPAALPFAALLLALLVAAKSLLIYVLARVGRVGARPLQLAVGLSQVGEFSFVLASVGLAAGAVTAPQYAALLSIVVLTIAASAVLARRVGPREPGVPGPATEAGL